MSSLQDHFNASAFALFSNFLWIFPDNRPHQRLPHQSRSHLEPLRHRWHKTPESVALRRGPADRSRGWSRSVEGKNPNFSRQKRKLSPLINLTLYPRNSHWTWWAAEWNSVEVVRYAWLTLAVMCYTCCILYAPSDLWVAGSRSTSLWAP